MSELKQSERKYTVGSNDKKANRYSDAEKIVLYELFEKYQEIIDIKLRRNLYSSTKQCEVRECWEIITNAFNAQQQTSNRTIKQLQKFWLNAKLRRMFPYDKRQAEMKQCKTCPNSLPQNKKVPSASKRSNVELQTNAGNLEIVKNVEIDLQAQQQTQSKEDCEIEQKPQVFNIEYLVPDDLEIQEHQPAALPPAPLPPVNYELPSTDNCPTSGVNRIDEDDEPMVQEDLNEILEEDERPMSTSNKQKMESLRLQEMENRVCESQLRCEAQKLIISKAQEELQHTQRMNEIKLQEAKIRLKLLERHCSNGRPNMDFLGI